MGARTLITGARCIDPASGLDAPRSLLVEDGHIAAVPAPNENVGDVAHRFDAAGLVLCPGLVDLHVHLREPGGEGAETIDTGTMAAAAGGYTTVYCMPNTSPVIDSPITVRYVLDRAADAGRTRVRPIAAVTMGQAGAELSDFAALREAGAGALSDDGRPVGSAEVMRRAMEHAAHLGMVIFDHCEDMALTGEGVMHEGDVALRLGLKGIPRQSEAACVARDAMLALMTGCRLHVCHVSNKESVEVLRHFKRRGAPVTAEVSPHHLTLTDEAVAGRAGPCGTPGSGIAYDTHAKMKPPLCDESDRQALIEALEDGTIDCIATDHAPHSAASKSTTFNAAPFGIIGMETALGVLHSAFVKPGRWTLEFLIDKMACAPVRVMGRAWGDDASLAGTLGVGAPADLCLLKLDSSYTLDAASLRSKSRNCPWIGASFDARCVATTVGGRWVFGGERFTGSRRA